MNKDTPSLACVGELVNEVPSLTRLGEPVAEPAQINRPFDYVPSEEEYNKVKIARLHNLQNHAHRKVMQRINPVSAIQLTEESWNEVCSFVVLGSLKEGRPAEVKLDKNGNLVQSEDSRAEKRGIAFPLPGADTGLVIGKIAREGDWIVRGTDNQFHVFSNDFFHTAFVEVD
jgi:hypothetical protein